MSRPAPRRARVRFGVLPLAGHISGRVISASPVSIHGDRYLDLLLQTAEQVATDQATRLRVAAHAVAPGATLAPNQHVRVTFLMQQVTLVEVIAPEEQTP